MQRRTCLKWTAAYLSAIGWPALARTATSAANTAPPDEERSPARSPVADIGPARLTVRTTVGAGVLRAVTSHDLDTPQPKLQRALIILHGRLRDAQVYFATAQAAVQAAGVRGAGTLIVAPQFLAQADAQAHGLSADTLRWTLTGWQGGEDALTPARISSFEALDLLRQHLEDRARFPALREIVVAGHSGGGQVVQRYAMLAADSARALPVRYVVANPSSYAWFGAARPRADIAATCSDYDDWKYGLNALPRVAAGRDAAALEARYIAQDVTLLLGGADTDPAHPALDRSCAAQAQGAFRLERGQAFMAMLRTRHPQLKHRQITVPGVGHDGRGMFTSAEGLASLFGA